MRSAWASVRRPAAPVCKLAIPRSSKRPASLTSAVERGIRRARAASDRARAGYDRPTVADLASDRDFRKEGLNVSVQRKKDGQSREGNSSIGFNRLDDRKEPGTLAERDRRPQASYASATGPISIPYTTPASEFIYGTFAVIAALKARRRKFYKLYVEQDQEEQTDRDEAIVKLARSRRVKVQYVGPEWARILNKMAEGRPYNGVVLEASSLPKPQIRALKRSLSISDNIEVLLGNLSEEDGAIVADPSVIERDAPKTRFPFVLLLDRVLDPGNLGAIIRSAYFLGVDAIVMSRSGSAPTSAVTIKASAGAAEVLPLLITNVPLDFVKRSKSNGWKIFSAVSPESESGQTIRDKFIRPDDALSKAPCVLVMGGEGEGISWSLMRESDGFVGVSQVVREGRLDVVESLNVSVAAALMIQQFALPS